MAPRIGAFVFGSFWRPLGWTGLALGAVGLAVVLLRGGTGEVWNLALLLVFTLSALLPSDRVMPPIFGALAAALGIMHSAGILWELYDDVSWYDDAAHFFGGFVAASVLGYVLLANLVAVRLTSGAALALWLGGLAVVVGIGWEILELFLIEVTWADTATDVVLDGIGGALAGPLVAWALRGKAKSATRIDQL